MTAFEKLSPQRQTFVKEYVVDFNGVRAATAAGYKGAKTSIANAADRNLNNPLVQQAIKECLLPAVQEAELSVEKVLNQLHNFVFHDLTEYIDDAGFLTCSPKELPKHLRQCIKEINGSKIYDNENGEVVGERCRITLVDKEKALGHALKYLGLIQPDVKNINIGQATFTLAQLYEQTKEPLPPPIEAKIEALTVDAVPKEKMNGKPKKS